MNEFEAENLVRDSFETEDEVWVCDLTRLDVKDSSHFSLSSPRYRQWKEDTGLIMETIKRLRSEGYCKLVYDGQRRQNKIVLTKKGEEEKRKKALEVFEVTLDIGEAIVHQLILPEDSREFGGENSATFPIYHKVLKTLEKKYLRDGFAYCRGNIKCGRHGYLIIPRDLYPKIALEVCQPLKDGSRFSLLPTVLTPREVWAAYKRDEKIKEVS